MKKIDTDRLAPTTEFAWPTFLDLIRDIVENQNEIMTFLDKVSMSRRPNEVIYSDTPRFEE